MKAYPRERRGLEDTAAAPTDLLIKRLGPNETTANSVRQSPSLLGPFAAAKLATWKAVISAATCLHIVPSRIQPSRVDRASNPCSSNTRACAYCARILQQAVRSNADRLVPTARHPSPRDAYAYGCGSLLEREAKAMAVVFNGAHGLLRHVDLRLGGRKSLRREGKRIGDGHRSPYDGRLRVYDPTCYRPLYGIRPRRGPQ